MVKKCSLCILTSNPLAWVNWIIDQFCPVFQQPYQNNGNEMMIMFSLWWKKRREEQSCKVIFGTLFARQESIALIRLDREQLFWSGVFHLCHVSFFPIYLLNDNVASIHPSNWRASNEKLMNRTKLNRWLPVHTHQIWAHTKREAESSHAGTKCLVKNLVSFALLSGVPFVILSVYSLSWSVLWVCSTSSK